jgi:PAS domain S-box-containing protein
MRTPTGRQNASVTEADYRLLAEYSTDIVIAVRIDGTIRYTSPAIRDVLGYEPEDVVGANAIDFIHPDDRIAVAANLSERLRSVGPLTSTYRMRRKDGTFAWIEIASRLVTDPATGRPVERIANLRDISRRKAAEDELAKARDAAERASRAKSDFLTGMSHEIRTPMHSIVGTAELLLGSDLGDRQREYVRMLREAASDLLRVINDVLDISELETGRLQLARIDFDLHKVVWQCVDLMGPKATEKDSDLDCVVEDGACCRLRGDPARLRQVLLNVMGHAVKSTQGGRISVAVGDPAIGAGQASVRFEVRDTGAPISDEDRRRLLSKVAPGGETMLRQFAGSILDLGISKQLIDAMGGEIGVASRPGEKNIFWFTLPFSVPEASLPHAPAMLGGDQPTRKSGEGKRVLLAEDVFINQVIATDLLVGEAYQVDVVQDGEEALEAARARDYDLILMDIQMPVLDGIEATARIRHLPGSRGAVPIIALTADTLKDVRKEYLAAGFTDFLSKPFDPDALFATVERWTTRPATVTPVSREPADA